RIIDLRRTDPPGFREHKRPPFSGRPTDAVVWEFHVRDFTIDPSSGVADEKRGKYLGAAMRGTVSPDSRLKTCIDHLVELGVTHVQVLPLQDFDNKEHEEFYDWGYMPVNFSSPEGWYASNPRDELRIRELKEMVMAFHEAGIRVILDVVYNHTAAAAGFERMVPGYYHRRHRDGSYWNGSGCGNEIRSEAPMARRFIVENCRYWAEEFGMDGFRFDLMGLVDFETMCAVRDEIHKFDPTLLVYGEPWAATGPDGTGIERITDKWTVAGSGIGAFNDHFRNALKGPPDGDEPGFIQAGTHRDAVIGGIMGGIHDWAHSPADAVQYATCHDNLTLWDKIDICTPQASAEEKIKMQMLAIGILAVSQGMMFLHGGMEFGRSKFGHHNSYNAPDRVNRIDWRRKALFPKLYDYTRGMIRLRLAHPVFRLADREEVERRLVLHQDLCPSGPCIAFSLDGSDLEGETWSRALVLINGAAWDRTFKLPDGTWSVYTYAIAAGNSRLGSLSDSVAVPARGMVVLALE
ncbi:MAG: type I pullulanase, partial [Candidatus Sumerlaeia bacterium]|nr:type I pullulanase [Candidatus Sumerlaeia bacterium]